MLFFILSAIVLAMTNVDAANTWLVPNPDNLPHTFDADWDFVESPTEEV
jgi:hypothetical protein